MPLFDTYDVIFAGGGTAACIIAGRLARADPSLKILIIEAGSHSFDLPRHVQPARYLNSLGKAHAVTFHQSVKSDKLGGRSLIVPAGCCVGGGSAVNFMIYTRASASDYDDWEKLGNPGWGSDTLIPLARKVETYQVPSGDPSVHGFTGPIKVSHGGCDTNIGREFIKTAAQYDPERESSAHADFNDFYSVNVYAVNVGISKRRRRRYIDSCTGKRSDTAHYFLYNLPNFTLDPLESTHNVHVLTHRRVVKVLFENNRAVGVEYVAREDIDEGHPIQPRTARASRLVILSSGAFGSPAILERSGIGSVQHLAEANIPQVVDLPGVGENYNDHDLCVNQYNAADDSDCLDDLFSGDEEIIKPHLKEWQEKGTGLLAHNSVDAGVKLRPTPKELGEIGPAFRSAWQEFYANAPDKPVALFGVATGSIIYPDRTYKKLIYSSTYPRSLGSTHITSAENPWAPLKFDPQFLHDPADLPVLRWVYKRGREFARRMKSFRGEIRDRHPNFSPESSAWNASTEPVPIDAPNIEYSKEDDEAIDDYIRATVSTTWHSLGTCAMKPREAGGVVDSRLNVYGVENLKVADISIAPSNVGANTNNTALVIGEKAFLLIAEDLGLPSICF
ncbi:hypothetical protein F5880DRAFT_1472940 [Lentinula raphanica]|nr:hypothetical protein F5880DRAFT_1472940 [Lentinula raphanica]